MKDKSLLKVEELEIAFPQGSDFKQVVKKITFDIQVGEIVGMVGESGSGKSLTALSIMGLLPQSAIMQNGRIIYTPQQSDLTQIDEQTLTAIRGRQVAMVFQEPMSSLNPVFKCGAQIEEAILTHQNISKKAAKNLSFDWMNRVGLTDLKRIYDAYPHQLSGGQKQRVMIAMAMCCEPQLLIADEPTTALDVTVQKKILELLLSLKADLGIGILLISHDLAVVGEIADRVIVMQHGNIMETGFNPAIFKDPQAAYTKGLLACKPVLGKSYYRLPTIQLSPPKEIQSKTELTNLSAEKRTTQIPLIKLEQLNVSYEKQRTWWKKSEAFQAVQSVSLDIYQNETLGLVGESGSGKSTLGKALAKLKNYSGNIFFKGRDYTTLKANKDFYRSVQIIFQDPYSALNPRLPIGEAITEPMRVHKIGANEKERKAKTIDLLKNVGLQEEDYNKYPHQFSGGQRQRVSIARALSVEPRFLICDEVVSALDVSVQAQVLNLLKDLQEEQNLTYLFISHDLAVVQFMSDRIAVMKTGEIVELAETQEIYNNPQHPYTQLLIDAIPGKDLIF